MGGVQNGSGNSEGVGGYFSGQKMEIAGRRGALREIPSMVGVWIFSGTTQLIYIQRSGILEKSPSWGMYRYFL